MGTANGIVAGVLAPLHNSNTFAGSRDATGNPADPPTVIERQCAPGAPGLPSDSSIIHSGDAFAPSTQWGVFRSSLEGAHDSAHGFFGIGNIASGHSAFEDPFVFLLHANVDRLFAQWQTEPGQEYRLGPDDVYGDESDTTGEGSITHPFQPWDGSVEFGAPIAPWIGGSSAIEVKNCRHPSVVKPPCYDTLPLTVTQVAPLAGQPIRFLDAVEGEQTARALRLRVRGCRQVTCNATLTGDAAFSLLSTSVTSPEPDGFESHDVLIWVLFNPGAVGSIASGTLQVAVPETGSTFSVSIEANVIAKPAVAASLVLDRSGSMDLPSGVANNTRMQILRMAAPLFVTLLDDADGIGVVRFDTDAVEATPVQVAGSQIAGIGRTAALSAINSHATNPAGLTAIGDGLEAAANQLATVAALFPTAATVVFTDGFETAPKYISEVADIINNRVFAIGLGTPDQLNPSTLNDLVDSSGGFLMLTGNPGPDDQILLQKYFAQVLAGVTNSQIVVDPEGFVTAKGKTTVPYFLTEADSRSDVIVLSPAAEALDIQLEAPDGTIIDATNGAELVASATYQTLRVNLSKLSKPQDPAGRWLAHLSIDRKGLARWLRQIEEKKEHGTLVRLNAHGIQFTLTVQARSSLKLSVRVDQPSRLPGSKAQIMATLTQASIPLTHSAKLSMNVTDPAGIVSNRTLKMSEPGVFCADLSTSMAGVYRILVRAEGTTLHGVPFTREELRTVSVWKRGDEPSRPANDPIKPGIDWCGLLHCITSDDVLRKFADQNGIDLERLRECVKKYC